MRKITFANFRYTLVDGADLVYGGVTGIVKKDDAWEGGFKINGRSIKNILEEHGEVYMIHF